MITPGHSLPRVDPPGDSYSVGASLHAEKFDDLVRELVPKVRLLLPDLTEIEVLRAAARMAEYRLIDEQTLVWDAMRPGAGARPSPPPAAPPAGDDPAE